MPIKVRHNGLELDGNLLPLVSGAVHYWRLDPLKWGILLDQVKELGFHLIETYIPWGVHETGPGEFDFGRLDPAKNLDAFLSLAQEKGLKVLVRPGPHINSELPYFGFPRRVVENPEFWARDAQGSPVVIAHLATHFPVPSHASEKFLAEFEPFLAAASHILQKHQYPRGGVVAIQVDNETGYFFQPATYRMDYCPDSVKLFRHFLELKYRNPKALNAAYGAAFSSFDQVEPPRANTAADLKQLRPFLDWAEYKEYQIQWFLSKLAEMFRAKGLDLPLYQNGYGQDSTPFNVAEAEKDSGLDFYGLDAYPFAKGAGQVVDTAKYLSLASSLPYFPEYGAGCWPHAVARDEADFAATILSPFMGGARGVNFYMLVERERWIGSPLSCDGVARPGLAGPLKELNRFLKELDWSSSFLQVQALLMETREDQILEASFQRPGSGLEYWPLPASSGLDPRGDGILGPGDPGPKGLEKFKQEAREFIRDRQLNWARADSSIPADKMKKASLILLASRGILEEGFARRLRAFVEAGGLLVVGPTLPCLNEKLEPFQVFKDLEFTPGKPTPVGDGRMLLCLGALDAKAAGQMVQRARLASEVTLSDKSLEFTLHRLSGKHILFARNPHADTRTFTVNKEGKFVLKPLWAGGKFLGAVEEREVRLAPYETKVWEVISC